MGSPDDHKLYWKQRVEAAEAEFDRRLHQETNELRAQVLELERAMQHRAHLTPSSDPTPIQTSPRMNNKTPASTVRVLDAY